MDETETVHEPEIVEEDETLDLRRTDVPVTIEEIAALGLEESEAIIQARVQIIRTLRAQSIKQTHPSDWVLYKEKNTQRVNAYLEDKGCQRLMDLWGVEVTAITTPERVNSEDGQSFAYSVMGDGFCKVTRRAVKSIEGVRYSTERFAQEQPAGIQREIAVKKAARANLEGRIVRNLAGLNGVPLEELITVTGIKDFEQKASKGRGYGTQAERQGAQMRTAPDLEPAEYPKCGTCNAVMRYIPAGKTDKGTEYDAFWSCPAGGHKYTLKHAQAVTEAKTMREAAAREPGDEPL
jgi:hypothetical protein